MTGFSLTTPVNTKADLTLYQGKTISIPLVWGGSTPIDVTGFSAKLCAKKSFRATTFLTEFTVGNGRVSIGTTNGLITFNMTAADSASLAAPLQGVYEIEVTSATNVVYSALSGKFIVSPEVCT